MPIKLIFGLLFFAAGNVAHAQIIQRAFCADDASLHVVYVGAKTKVVPKKRGQVACDDVTIAEGKHTVGWSVLADNCCTSYPIAVSVAVLHDGRRRIFHADQMVWHWKFIEGASKLAMLSGPVHGNASAAILYNVASSKRLAEWHGDGAVPPWASGWEQEFASPENPK